MSERPLYTRPVLAWRMWIPRLTQPAWGRQRDEPTGDPYPARISDLNGCRSGWSCWRTNDWTDAAECWPLSGLLVKGGLPARPHHVPAFDCECGWYGLRALEGFSRCGVYTSWVGIVALKGRIVEHEWGFRAQYAKPVGLIGQFALPEDEFPFAPNLPIWTIPEAIEHARAEGDWMDPQFSGHVEFHHPTFTYYPLKAHNASQHAKM